MKYISTRSDAQPKDFIDVLLAGMAPDGGLYMPDKWPAFDVSFFKNLQGQSYAQIAIQILSRFTAPALEQSAIERIINDTYNTDNFTHQSIAPLQELGTNLWLMELYHGPTLSFKDYALQLLGRLFDTVLEQQNKHITIVGATSGDTGSAAIEACKGCKNIDIFILHPHNRTSAIQRKQMTTIDAPNVHNIALEGNFDDCQAFVKALFADNDARTTLNLSAVNSINWARIMAQTVYYVAAGVSLGTPDRPVSFAVPTGNFGNVFAAFIARKMGLPVHSLVIGTNKNDIVTRFFETGIMEQESTTKTLSPSMDIQISSNFERYLSDLLSYDHMALSSLMNDFKTSKSFKVKAEHHAKAQKDFAAYKCDDETTMNVIAKTYKDTGILIDPHTAVGLYAAQSAVVNAPDIPMVALACAHPAKFPEAVEKATGIKPELPEHLDNLLSAKEHFTVLQNDYDTVKSFITSRV